MRRRGGPGVAIGAGSFVLFVLACGSERPPTAEYGAQDGSADGAPYVWLADGGAPRDAGFCAIPEGDGGAAKPVTECSCFYAYSSLLGITLPCGYMLCTQGKNESAICELDGRLRVERGFLCTDAGYDASSGPVPGYDPCPR